jgi:hypothetical protein
MKPVGIRPNLILRLTKSDLSGLLPHQFTEGMNAKLTVIYTHKYFIENLVRPREE